MPVSRRRFSQEFKDELCREVISSSKSIKDVAVAYGVGPETLRNWLVKYRENNGGTETELTVTERARLKELERENQELRAETAFPKKRRLTSRGSSGSEQVRIHRLPKIDPENTNPVTKMCHWLQVSTCCKAADLVPACAWISSSRIRASRGLR